MKIFTIGFTQKTAEQFFTLLKENGIKMLVDTRLNNKSQLAGFAKGTDLKYFLKEILGIEYSYRPDFAPTKELLQGYRKNKISWGEYEEIYVDIIKKRRKLENSNLKEFDKACFLCSEHEPDQCHRRLLAELIASLEDDVKIKHLM